MRIMRDIIGLIWTMSMIVGQLGQVKTVPDSLGQFSDWINGIDNTKEVPLQQPTQGLIMRQVEMKMLLFLPSASIHSNRQQTVAQHFSIRVFTRNEQGSSERWAEA